MSLLLPVVHQAAVLVVVTSRPDRDTPGWRLVTAARDLFGEALAEIALEPLSVEDSRELVCNLLEIESLPERLRELILQRTEGNPFFLEEVIRMLIDLWTARSVELAVRCGDPNAILDANLVLGGVEATRGNLHEAVTYTRRAIEEAERVGNTLCSLVGHFQLGDQQLQLGNPEEAIPALERSGELAEFCDAWTLAALSEAWLAVARAQLHGEVDWDGFESALVTAHESGHRLGEAAVHHLRAVVRASLPDPDWTAVFADFSASIAIFTDIGARPFLAETLRSYGMALEAAGRAEEAAEILRRAEAILSEMESEADPTAAARLM